MPVQCMLGTPANEQNILKRTIFMNFSFTWFLYFSIVVEFYGRNRDFLAYYDKLRWSFLVFRGLSFSYFNYLLKFLKISGEHEDGFGFHFLWI